MFSLCSAVATHQLPSQINTHSSLVRSQLCSSTKHQCVQTNHTQHLGNSSKWISLNINKLSKKDHFGLFFLCFQNSRLAAEDQQLFKKWVCSPIWNIWTWSGLFRGSFSQEDHSSRACQCATHLWLRESLFNNYPIQYSFVFVQVAIPNHCWS